MRTDDLNRVGRLVLVLVLLVGWFAKKLPWSTSCYIPVLDCGLLGPNHDPIDCTYAHFEISVAPPCETFSYLSLFSMIGRKLDVDFLAFVDGINNPPDTVVDLRMRHSMGKGDVVCTSSCKIT